MANNFDDILASLENPAAKGKPAAKPAPAANFDALLVGLGDGGKPAATSTTTTTSTTVTKSASATSTPTKPASQADLADQISKMVSSMENDIKMVDKDPNYAGLCEVCGKVVTIDKVVHSEGKKFHAQCMLCGKCNAELGNTTYIEHLAKRFCVACYHADYSDVCAHCNEKITGDSLNAMQKSFHPNCFVCAHCGCGFPDGQFHEKSGKPYCRPHVIELFATPCAKCGKGVEDGITVKEKEYHRECLTCTTCSVVLTTQVYEHNTQPYCQGCFVKKTAKSCAGCGQSIVGQYLEALGLAYHPEHFTCTRCGVVLNPTDFRSRENMPYCTKC